MAEIKISVTGSSASSQKYDRPSSQAFDGNTTEWAWWATEGGHLTNEWVAGHISSQIINKIRFYASLDAGKNIKHAKLEGSNDGDNWTKIPATGWTEGASRYNGDEILFASPEGWQEVTFNNETSYTRYRLFCYDAYIELAETPVHIIVSELEFYYDDGKPSITSFAIDEGASSTKDREVTLDNVCTGDPTHYMASEDPDFVLSEIWQGNHDLASSNKVQDFDAGSSVDWELFSLTVQDAVNIQFRSKSATTQAGLAAASYGAWQDGITGSITAGNNRWLRVEIGRNLWWSKCEDNASITSPMTGVGATINGALTYASAKFNNGVKDAASVDGATTGNIEINVENLFNTPVGCIEFWMKMLAGEQGFNDRKCAINTNDLDYNGAFFAIDPGAEPDDGSFGWGFKAGATTLSSSIGGLTWGANELIHIGVSWDSSVGVYLYKNGVLVGTKLGTWTPADVTGITYFLNSDDGLGGVFLLDNIKIWNYKKTDFSDRNVEG